MTGIQWVLLILVAGAVVGVYFYLRRQSGVDPWQGMEEGEDGIDRGEALGGDSYIVGVRTVGAQTDAPSQTAARSAPKASPEPRPEPAGDNPDEPSWMNFTTGREAPEPKAAPAEPVEAVRPQRPPSGEQRLFVLHISSRDGSLYDGPDIHAALQEQKLKFGLHGIYHRITEANGVPESVFSIANILKPGFLDPVEADHLQTPGLALFLQLPGPLEGSRAARDLLDTAAALAERLGAEVLDDKRSLLKPQTAQYMLDEIAELDRRQRLAAHR